MNITINDDSYMTDEQRRAKIERQYQNKLRTIQKWRKDQLAKIEEPVDHAEKVREELAETKNELTRTMNSLAEAVAALAGRAKEEIDGFDPGPTNKRRTGNSKAKQQ